MAPLHIRLILAWALGGLALPNGFAEDVGPGYQAPGAHAGDVKAGCAEDVFSEEARVPVRERIAQFRKRGPVPVSVIFREVTIDRARGENLLRPWWISRQAVTFLDGLHEKIQQLFGPAVSKTSWFRDSLLREFELTGRDYVAFSEILERETADLFAKLVQSIRSDIHYTDAWSDLTDLLDSAPTNPPELVTALIKLGVHETSLAHLAQEKGQRRTLGLTPERGLPMRHVQAVNNVRRDIEAARTTIKNALRSSSFYEHTLSYEVLRLLNALQQHDRASQEMFAAFYVQWSRMEVLRRLVGEIFPGVTFHSPPSRRALVTVFLRQNRQFLEDPEVLGNQLEPTHANTPMDHESIQAIADRWVDLWGARVTTLAPQLDYLYARVNLRYAVGRFLAETNFARQADALGDIWRRVVQFRTHRAPKRASSSTVEQRSQRDLETSVIKALERLIQSLDHDKVSPQAMANELSTVSYYLSAIDTRGLRLHSEIERRLCTSDGMKLLSFLLQHGGNDHATDAYRQIIAGKIVQLQVGNMASYRTSRRDIMAKLSLVATGTFGAMILGKPIWTWVSTW